MPVDRTPLMLACAAGLEEVVNLLIDNGADVLTTDLEGNTPLHYSYAYARLSIPAILEAAGATMKTPNFRQQYPDGLLGMGEDGLRPKFTNNHLHHNKKHQRTHHSTRK